MNQIDISIIIPLYKGEQYIPYWIDKIVNNRKLLKKKYEEEVELVFINDYPDRKIMIEDGLMESELNISIIESEYNRGIHGARVFGLQNAKGEYIVFMDQDDRIEDTYLIEQFSKIGNNDWIICNGYKMVCLQHGKKKIFKDNATLEEKLKRHNIIMGNPIKSPSQVLIKKNAIPAEWIENILDSNGLDDYFLWLLFTAHERKYVINDSLLYMHMNHIDNASNNIQEMLMSMEKVIHYLKVLNAYSEKELKEIQIQLNRNSMDSKSHLMIRTLDKWLYVQSRGKKIADYLLEQKINSTALYGMGIIGERLFDELFYSNVQVKYLIDQKAEEIECEVPVVHISEIDRMDKVDAVIITILENDRDILEQMEKRCTLRIIFFKDILYQIIEQIMK